MRFPISRSSKVWKLPWMDVETLLRMMKGALPPTIAVAIYQTDAISNITITVGYLTVLTAIFSQCLLPRGKFLKIMGFILFTTCMSAAICCLAVYSAIKARDSSQETYNSSACAVCAIWLFFVIWISNSFRAYQPVMLQDPMVAFAIFGGVTLTRAGQFTTMEQGLNFIRQLLITFILGFAIAIGVSLLFLPISGRRNVLNDVSAYAKSIHGLLEAQITYIEDNKYPFWLDARPHQSGEKLRAKRNAIIAIHSRMAGDIAIAKSEFAWGKLSPKDLQHLFTILRSMMLPLTGLSMLPEVFENPLIGLATDIDIALWKTFMKNMASDLKQSLDTVALGTSHAMVLIGVHSSLHQPDVEKTELCPGATSFASLFRRRTQDFFDERQSRMVEVVKSSMSEQCMVFLFFEHLITILLQETLELVTFAENVSKREHFIIPSFQLPLRKLQLPRSRGDPEHRPAASRWERIGEVMATMPRLLGSSQSAFGFRVAIAAFCVAILAFIRQTQTFFFTQRIIWVLIVIVLGMSPTSGASSFGYFVRVISTSIAYGMALAIWYIVVGHTGGVIVMLFLGNMIEVGVCLKCVQFSLLIKKYYFHIKYPKLFGASLISVITMNIIVAYELQVNKIGRARAESSGQPYYATWEFGAYKLLCVIVACAISLAWTIFPYPIASSSKARKVLGRSLFVLANFHSCMHSTVGVWIQRHDNTPKQEERLALTKDRLFAEGMDLITALRTHSNLSKYDPPVGGKFPSTEYNNIASEIQTVLISMALMIQTTRVPVSNSWLQSFAKAMKATNFNSHVTTSLLCHLSSAVSNAQALPPYLSPPPSFAVTTEIRKINADLLEVKNADDVAFSTFASLEVMSGLIGLSLRKLTTEVRTLVGEVSFAED